MRERGFSKTVTVILFLLLIGLVFSYYQLYGEYTSLVKKVDELSGSLSNLSEKLRGDSTTTVVVTTTYTAIQSDVRSVNWGEIYERVKESVVLIETVGRVGGSTGTGFLYDTNGHIITNFHVVDGGQRYYARFIDGALREARLIGGDRYTDLAVLRIDVTRLNVRPLNIGDSDELRIGEEVAVVGNPYGLELSWSLSIGIVNQKKRLYTVEGGYSIPDMIQIDAAVNPGNSGSPLLNSKGEVVGVVNAIRSESGGFEGIGYAISASVVKRVVPVLIERGSYQHSWLGVSGVNVDARISESRGLSVSYGFLVESVVSGGPAETAGIRRGDVITELNRMKIQSLADLLSYLLVNTKPGDVVEVRVFRGNQTLTFNVVLGIRPR
ncbi:MAG: trypsin-like peptidase domain-containing protein [Aigarchaeota archaeon]|nr:trypsin-like peptidase domain-containing protein [Aigarchaeota archaeon]MDW8093110.1 trypsin-like peptidase domain-containing protein [Nitrososphaerota archaeon]